MEVFFFLSAGRELKSARCFSLLCKLCDQFCCGSLESACHTGTTEPEAPNMATRKRSKTLQLPLLSVPRLKLAKMGDG